MPNEKQLKVDLVKIDAARIYDVCEGYFSWKSLNDKIKSYCSRGINFPDAISEPMGCFALGYLWNKGTAGDAQKPNGQKVEFKATSNFYSDLTSFGPEIDFNDLVFLRLDQEHNRLWVYDTGYSALDVQKIQVNKNETLADQQRAHRRPRIRFIDTIEQRGLKPTVVFDILSRKNMDPSKMEPPAKPIDLDHPEKSDDKKAKELDFDELLGIKV